MALGLRLGPFLLKSPAGRGGMADVWRAVHRAHGTSVAVKIMTTMSAYDDGLRRRFVEEVRAVARLDHPGIIRLHDYGTVPDAISQQTGGLLPSEVPYLVMDWHGGGTLGRRVCDLPFGELKSNLLALLDALAHAHARGVIHRDIKPDNVLLGERGPVLTDFGVVFSLDGRGAPGRHVAGTPNYMAPEQVRNDWRSFGPWTDLYALGCLAWTLVTGRAPYGGGGPLVAMKGHVTGTLPALIPQRAIPEGFEIWLERLLARDPRARFRHAADAAVALMALPDALPDAPRADVGSVGADDDRTLFAPPRFIAIDETAWRAGPTTHRRPPMPSDWRRPEGEAHAPPLAGCGRALVELREPAMQGRAPARDRLWQQLAAVVGGGGARAVILDGPAGIGKSRLATWIARRGHELGQSERLLASHGPTPGPTHGPGPMLSRALRLDGLSADDAATRLVAAFDLEPGKAAAVAAAVSAERAAGVGGIRVELRGESERLVALADGLGALVDHRALVVHVDDAQWGDEALRLVGYVLSRRPTLPALFVITVRPGDLAADRLAPSLLESLARRPEVDRLSIGPLDPREHGALSAARLSLEPATLERLVGATRGNPLFAIELLRHWLQCDALEETARGARLRADRPMEVPPDLAMLWRVRVAGVLADITPDPMPALELAAVGGIAVDEAAWASSRAQAGLDRPDAALERLLDVGLVRPLAAGGWAFAHGMLRDALEVSAADAGRRQRWHTAWAAGLTARAHAAGHGADPERLAGHHAAAGDYARALPLWLDAARRTAVFSGMATAGRPLMAAARCGRALRVDRGGPRWTRLRIIWSEYLFAASRPGASRHVRRALVVAKALGDAELECQVYLALGTVVSARSRVEAVPVFRAARDVAAARCDPRRQAETTRRLGVVLMGLGRFAEAGALFASAEALDRAIDDPDGLGLTQRHQSELALAVGDLQRADTMARASLVAYTARGNRLGQTAASTVIGEVARRRGQLAAAEAAYNEAWRVLDGIEHVDAAALALNLAQISIARNDWPAAEQRATWVRERAILAQHTIYRSIAETMLVCCAGRAGDRDAWDRAWAGLGPVQTLTFTEVDVAAALALAAELAADALPERAAAARALAIRQYRALGRTREAERLRRD